MEAAGSLFPCLVQSLGRTWSNVRATYCQSAATEGPRDAVGLRTGTIPKESSNWCYPAQTGLMQEHWRPAHPCPGCSVGQREAGAALAWASGASLAVEVTPSWPCRSAGLSELAPLAQGWRWCDPLRLGRPGSAVLPFLVPMLSPSGAARQVSQSLKSS